MATTVFQAPSDLSAEAAKRYLNDWGPIVVGFKVPTDALDFFMYRSRVYTGACGTTVSFLWLFSKCSVDHPTCFHVVCHQRTTDCGKRDAFILGDIILGIACVSTQSP